MTPDVRNFLLIPDLIASRCAFETRPCKLGGLARRMRGSERTEPEVRHGCAAVACRLSVDFDSVRTNYLTIIAQLHVTQL